MVSDVIKFSTNQKTVNFFRFLNNFLVTVRNFWTKFFALRSEKFTKFFYNGVSTNHTPPHSLMTPKESRVMSFKQYVETMFIKISNCIKYNDVI